MLPEFIRLGEHAGPSDSAFVAPKGRREHRQGSINTRLAVTQNRVGLTFNILNRSHLRFNKEN